MKKLAIVLMAILLITSGCSNNSGKSNALMPSQIQFNGKILSYNSSNVDDDFFCDGINLRIGESNEVRSITIENNGVITYNNICVGDSIQKIKSKFNYEIEIF